MAAQDVIRWLGRLMEDDGETIRRRHGPEAVAAAEDMARFLADRFEEESAYAALWEAFEEDPEAHSAEVIGALEAWVEADPALARRIRDIAPVPVHAGTYASLWGPNYEAPAEIGMLRRAGAIAVGMSTGPEALALRVFGTRLAGISLITNVAVEVGGAIVTHDEVVTVGAARREAMQDLLSRVIADFDGNAHP
mgnify:CR=1 FL=1